MESSDATPALVGNRLVWGGRRSAELAGALDGWTCDRTDLIELMNEAAELLVLDPLSFPWEWLTDRHRDVPLVVVLPDDLGVAEIEALLGQPLLRHLTPWDTLVESRQDVRRALQKRWALSGDVWADVQDSGPDAALSTLIARSKDRLLEVTTDIGTFRAQAGDLVTEQLLEFGAHQRGTLNVVLALCREGDTVLDVGGHIGTFAVPMARRVGPSGRIISIEGMPQHAELLRINVRANHLSDRVTVIPRIVGVGGGALFVGQSVHGNTGGSSFERAAWRTPGACPSTSLDELLDEMPELSRTSLVKLDIEGAELDALQGAEKLIETARPLLTLEISNQQMRRRGASARDVEAWLSVHEYAPFLVDGVRNKRGSGWELTSLESLDTVDEPLFDVLAVPLESSRLAELNERSRDE